MSAPRSSHLAGFPPAIGLHCSSTSVRTVLAFDGVTVSEATAFGLGSGLGLFYVEQPGGSPTRVLNGRAPDLEGSFFRRAGAPLAWAGRWDPEALAACLARGRPVLAQTDLCHLPYYQPAVHFPGHGVVVVGLDLEGGEATIADQGFAEVQRTTLESLRRAMEATAPPLLPNPYRWAPAPRLDAADVLRPEAFRDALEQTRRIMAGEACPDQGLPALEHLIERLPSWSKAPDLGWCARFAYQGIEKRGTGGGAFRFLYADFLREAQTPVPALGAMRVADRYAGAGEGWRELASRFKSLFLSDDPARLAACTEAARGLLAAEREALESLASALRAG